NYKILRKELSGSYEFKTDTDTEVILSGYLKWGIKVLDRLKGMFAFALFDKRKNKVFLVRDRFGIKPLYYSLNHDRLIFASEIKAILASKKVERKMDISSFADYFVYRYIPSPKSIWQGINKIEPAHYSEIDPENFSSISVGYWKLGTSNTTTSEQELIADVDRLLQDSVAQHTISDVPVGSFLSGGYDSSALVYYAKKNGYRTDTFSIGFDNWKESEHNYAKLVADHLQVKNESVIADGGSLDLLDLMPEVYDEPIADISIVPTYMVSRLARKNVKAVLSGEGADELFGGYNWQKDWFAKNNPPKLIDRLKLLFKGENSVGYYAESMAMGWFGRKELTEMLSSEHHQHIADDVHWFYKKHFNPKVSPLKSVQLMDIKCFMAELVLTKVDRASMANSLEVRVPFLDHELFEKVFAIAEKNYYKQDVTKYLLHENLKTKLPNKIMQRQKQGFVGPDSYYMDIEWYRKQLHNSPLMDSGIVRPEFIDRLMNNKDHWRLWKLTVMSKWYGHYVEA
ncbi:MAG: asparagine synthase (glutamine-hydrolyzing), partial [Flavobacteriales bacterium]|nr:asparagine synthase (glutamine-hydrolyzing) [Flavobacteriales bacterium]